MRRRRRRTPMSIWDVDFGTVLYLEVGVSEEELRRTPKREGELRTIWEAVGHVLMPSPTCLDGHGDTEDDCFRAPPGTRPWAWWRFALEREKPDTEANQFEMLKSRDLLLGAWEEAAATAYLQRVAARDSWMQS